MPQLLCEEFCLVTKEKLARILSDQRASGKLSVGPLTDTMKATIAFEKTLNKRFSGGTATSSLAGGPEGVTSTAEAIRQKWQAPQRRSDDERANPVAAAAAAAAPPAPCERFNNIIR